MLVASPFVANADVMRSYTPWLVLRLWMAAFGMYGVVLSRNAGGFRRVWQNFYWLVVITFALVWGLSLQIWAVIDFTIAGLLLASAPFLRSEASK
jgi:hypothetical protein